MICTWLQDNIYFRDMKTIHANKAKTSRTTACNHIHDLSKYCCIYVYVHVLMSEINQKWAKS